LAGRDVCIPQDFIEALRMHVAGFREESERNQWGLALMAWEGGQKRRQHRTELGAMTFSALELHDLFGRGKCESLLHRIDFFQRSAGWSKKDGITRAYWFSAQVRQALAYYEEGSSATQVDLLWLSGGRMKVAKSLPKAISSTDTNGRTINTALWDRAKGMNRVPVNTKMLEALRLYLKTQLDDSGVEGPLRQFVGRLLDITAKIIRISNTTLAGPGHIPQTYSIAPTGRLYARGLNLQNSPGLIKEAALHGLWEYDFSNCHFAVVSQMAARFGVLCPVIEHYMANKSQVREEIAADVEISIDAAKQCLLALLYGARTSGRAKDAIPSVIGGDHAKHLYAQPTFKALSEEIGRARRAILANWPRTANGSLTNDCGKAIRGDTKAAAQLAHLVQGVEAKALMTVVNLHAEDMVLLQHDGFAARRRLDCRALEDTVFEEVEYRLPIEEQQLQLHVDVRELMIRTKSEMALEAAPDLDF
jgi:hypothetical protein